MQPKPRQLHIIQIIYETDIRRGHDTLVQLALLRDRVGRVVELGAVNVGGVGEGDEVCLSIGALSPHPEKINQCVNPTSMISAAVLAGSRRKLVDNKMGENG